MPSPLLRAAAAAGTLASAAIFTSALPAASQTPAPAASAAPAPAASAAPAISRVEDPAVTVQAKEILHRVQTGTVDRTQLSDDYNRLLTPDSLLRAGTQLAALGEPTKFAFDGKLTQGTVTAYVYHVTFVDGDLDELLAIDGDHKIVRLLFRLRPPGAASPAPSSSP